MMKRAWRLLVCLCMVCSLLPVTALAETVTEYDLWVGGVRVTSANKDDVLEDGKVSYDPTTNTLTLNNATIVGKETANPSRINDFGAIETLENPLNIVLKGNNTIEGGEGYSSYGMYIHGDLTISGDGSLNVSSANCATNNKPDNTWSVAVYATGDITINNCAVEATCGTAKQTAAAFSAWRLILNSVSVTEAIQNGNEITPSGYWDFLFPTPATYII